MLLGYSILYGLTARKARWLGGVTSAAVMILGQYTASLCRSFLRRESLVNSDVLD